MLSDRLEQMIDKLHLKSSRTRWLRYPLLLSGLLLAPLSLAGETKLSDDVEGRATLNAIHSEELKKTMRSLDLLAYENEYTELELQSLRVSQLNRLLDFVDELLARAEELPQITDTELSESDRIIFKAMAQQLHGETLNMKASAAEKNYSDMGKRYLELRRTCDSCHRLFRNTP